MHSGPFKVARTLLSSLEQIASTNKDVISSPFAHQIWDHKKRYRPLRLPRPAMKKPHRKTLYFTLLASQYFDTDQLNLGRILFGPPSSLHKYINPLNLHT